MKSLHDRDIGLTWPHLHMSGQCEKKKKSELHYGLAMFTIVSQWTRYIFAIVCNMDQDERGWILPRWDWSNHVN